MLKRLFSWMIVIAIAIYFLTIFILPFLGMSYTSLIFIGVGIAIAIAAVGAVGLIVLLVRERLKDMEKEKDDLNKY